MHDKEHENMISNHVTAMKTYIERFVSLNACIVEHLHSFKHAHYTAHPVMYANINFDYT